MSSIHVQFSPNAEHSSSLLHRLNTKWHERSLQLFLVIVLMHWAEHLTQAYQIWILDWPRPKALGVIGYYYPWLVHSEWLHYGYAIIMLVFFVLLLRGFEGRSRFWWMTALIIQFWHHIEHALLLSQKLAHHNFFGSSVPTSIIQLIAPRVELHLFYNTVVFIPMIISMIYHMFPSKEEKAAMSCSCAKQ
ncbi:hypothetical protein [Paenibacillus kobensis]|uniref:hypothetical protein n=1 Tax=Paenibacillus kobensis TaxID=59841 RepID=UPI000FDA7B71|nr:hypothetical protein [Paenibacillus kobensis]